MRAAIEAVIKTWDIASCDHAHNTQVIQAVSNICDSLGVVAEQMICRGHAQAEKVAEEEGGKNEYIFVCSSGVTGRKNVVGI